MGKGAGVIVALWGIALVLASKPLARYFVTSGPGAGSRGDRLKVELYQLVAVLLGVVLISVGLLILLGVARPAS